MVRSLGSDRKDTLMLELLSSSGGGKADAMQGAKSALRNSPDAMLRGAIPGLRYDHAASTSSGKGPGKSPWCALGSYDWGDGAKFELSKRGDVLVRGGVVCVGERKLRLGEGKHGVAPGAEGLGYLKGTVASQCRTTPEDIAVGKAGNEEEEGRKSPRQKGRAVVSPPSTRPSGRAQHHAGENNTPRLSYGYPEVPPAPFEAVPVPHAAAEVGRFEYPPPFLPTLLDEEGCVSRLTGVKQPLVVWP